MPEICYKRDYLTQVIARIDFASPIQKFIQELPAKLSEKALTIFPILEPRKAIATELRVSPKAVEPKRTEFTEWNFHGRDREKRLVILNTGIFVEYKRYANYQTFKNDFTQIIEVLFAEVPEVVANRLGLRYINNFEIPNGDPFSWDDYFNAHLLSTLKFIDDKGSISRAFNNLELSFTDFNLRFQFGMPNPDYPASIRKRHFVLDFDAYHQGLQTFPEIPANLDRYHDGIQSLFESSITDKLREVLNA
ncbi:MAG: TIGR04255 family protein [Bacteroidetes bacterium]|nr:TIGR04255 family protein [Bacteroidota bacterium]